jgi:2-polyprenyl-6-methoxyphenol hydroxylase-like FAD-dependent oxidoreductase
VNRPAGFSVVLIYDGADARLRELRHATVFEAAVNAIPDLRDWTEPARSHAITGVLPGGMLYNTYCGQLDDNARPALPGMISIGDSVCTTTPLAGRGVALALMQSRGLLWTLDQHGHDSDSCVGRVRPLVFHQDQALVRRSRALRRRSPAALVRTGRRPCRSAAA